MTELTMDVMPTRMESGIVYAPFDEGLKVIGGAGLDLISLPRNAELRVQQGETAYISRNGNWVREGVIYTPNGKPRLVRNSTIITSATEATEAHRNSREFYPTQDAIEAAFVDSIDFPQSDIEIPTNRFHSDALTVFAFGGEQPARKYGEFLVDAGIKKMPVRAVDESYVNEQPQPFERQLWFGGLAGDRSDLSGGYRRLGSDCRVRGVRSVTAGEASARKISEVAQNSELYSPAQIALALKSLQLQGLEVQLMKGLRTK